MYKVNVYTYKTDELPICYNLTAQNYAIQSIDNSKACFAFSSLLDSSSASILSRIANALSGLCTIKVSTCISVSQCFECLLQATGQSARMMIDM